MRPSARSLSLELLSTLREGSMPVRALVEAGACFGIAENAMRVALARLLAAGRVERDERGRYRLGAGAEPVRRRIASWRQMRERTRVWDGSWVGVLRGRRRERALRFLGFRELSPVLALRPDNLRGGVDAVREELRGLGLESGIPVFQLRQLDPGLEARARSLWDVAALEAAYRRGLAELAASTRRLPALSEAEAMREAFLVGGRVIRQLVLDPLLPEPLAPAAPREALVRALRSYDRLGRAAWARFLAGHGVPHLRTPADTRIAAGAERLAAVGGGP